MHEFEKGNVVQLQSGGVMMTVTDIRSDGVLSCAWTDDQGMPQKISEYYLCFFKSTT